MVQNSSTGTYACGINFQTGDEKPNNYPDDVVKLLSNFDSFSNWIIIYQILVQNVKDRGQGLGSAMLQQFIKDQPEDRLIIARTFDYDNAVETQFNCDSLKHLEALCKFFIKNNFILICRSDEEQEEEEEEEEDSEPNYDGVIPDWWKDYDATFVYNNERGRRLKYLYDRRAGNISAVEY